MTPPEALSHLLGRLGVALPSAPMPVGVYEPVLRCGGYAFLSGQISKDDHGKVITGKVGKDLTLEQGKKAAQGAALQALSLIHAELGLERVERMVRLVGYVQSAPDFYQHSDVMNAASELFSEIWGTQGRHVRTSVGAVSLPLNAAVEIEVTLKLR